MLTNLKMSLNLVFVLKWVKTAECLGSGCGSVGRAVASDTRGSQFKSSHRQIFIYILNYCLLSTCIEKTKNKEKGGGMAHYFF